jgi:Polyketide cyclase / dehydrase and lipid transport
MEEHAMASIHKEILVDASPDEVWAAIRDVGDIHTRLARQFVVETRLDGESRLVTFANGAAIRERISTSTIVCDV